MFLISQQGWIVNGGHSLTTGQGVPEELNWPHALFYFRGRSRLR